MLEKQIVTLTTILKDKDIRNYSGGAFWQIIKAVGLGDVSALADAAYDIKNLIFQIPTVLFWDKMQRYLYGTFHDYSEQVKMSEKFTGDNAKYYEFVKKQMMLVDKIDDEKKIDHFAMLTRCFLLMEMDDALYFKLAHFINICTSEELEYIRTFEYNKKSDIDIYISSLYQYGLFEQEEKENGGTIYVLSGFGRALKSNSLNFEDEMIGERVLSYNQITPLSIPESATWEDIDELMKDI